jgi:hypothetical protein
MDHPVLLGGSAADSPSSLRQHGRASRETGGTFPRTRRGSRH